MDDLPSSAAFRKAFADETERMTTLSIAHAEQKNRANIAEAENEKLRAALVELIDDTKHGRPGGWVTCNDDYSEAWGCSYCYNVADSVETVPHDDDCPVAVARVLLQTRSQT